MKDTNVEVNTVEEEVLSENYDAADCEADSRLRDVAETAGVAAVVYLGFEGIKKAYGWAKPKVAAKFSEMKKKAADRKQEIADKKAQKLKEKQQQQNSEAK